MHDPDERIDLGLGQSWGPVVPGRPQRVTNAGGDLATFLVLHGIGDYDYVHAKQAALLRRPRAAVAASSAGTVNPPVKARPARPDGI
jgi:hypothetical protein